MEKLKSDAEVLYPSAPVRKESPPAASWNGYAPEVRAFWEAIARQTKLEQAERSMADVWYPKQGK